LAPRVVSRQPAVRFSTLDGEMLALDLGLDEALAGRPAHVHRHVALAGMDAVRGHADRIALVPDPDDPVGRRRQRRAELSLDLERPRRRVGLQHARQRRQPAEQLRLRGRALEAFGIFLGDEAGGDRARSEARMLHQRRQEIDIVPMPSITNESSASTCRSIAASRVGAQVISLAIIGS
jgi:hypothetical protein